MRKIPVVFAINNKYSQHCGVTISSILYNSNSEFCFYVLHIEDLILENKEKLKEILEYYKTKSQIKFVKLNLKLFSVLPESKIYTNNMYSRIFFPRLYPKLKKCIYLDSDLIVDFDLNALYSKKFKEPVMAILDPPMIFEDYHLKKNKLNRDYFNSGVLVININKFITQNIDFKCIKYLKKNKDTVKYPDQDALNHALKNNWHKLNLDWNVQRSFYLTENYNKYNKNILKQILTAIQKPKIIHYSSIDKPWIFGYKGQNKERYYLYLKKTPWNNFATQFNLFKFLKDITPQKIKNIIKKIR